MKLDLSEQLSAQRYSHTLRVMHEAVILAEKYGESVSDVEIAAILHDNAKCLSKEILHEYISQFDLPKILLEYHHELWHGPVGAELARRNYGISDGIYQAIYNHTAARENMSRLELIIFVADYIEPARDFPGVEEVRDLAKVSLEQAALKALQNTIIYLLRRNATVFPESILAYNWLRNKYGSDE